MYKYLIVTNGDNHYFPSNSRNSINHLKENNANNCWVYDKSGLWTTFAELDKTTNKANHPKMILDGEVRTQYAEMLQQFNKN